MDRRRGIFTPKETVDNHTNKTEQLMKENVQLRKMNEKLKKELKLIEAENKALRHDIGTYAELEELIQKISRPIIDQVVDEFQHVWAQRIAMQVEENIRQKLKMTR